MKFIGKCLQFDTDIIAFTKGSSSYMTKNRILLKKDVLLDLKISDFCLKWAFLMSRIRENGVFFKLEYEPGYTL